MPDYERPSASWLFWRSGGARRRATPGRIRSRILSGTHSQGRPNGWLTSPPSSFKNGRNVVTTSEQLTDETRGSEATPVGQLTAENRFIEAGADVFAYRRFGDAQAMALPLVMLQHFRGILDRWDPALVDARGQHREA